MEWLLRSRENWKEHRWKQQIEGAALPLERAPSIPGLRPRYCGRGCAWSWAGDREGSVLPCPWNFLKMHCLERAGNLHSRMTLCCCATWGRAPREAAGHWVLCKLSQVQEVTLFPPAVPLQLPLLTQFSIVPAGKEKPFKGLGSVLAEQAKRVNLEVRGDKTGTASYETLPQFPHHKTEKIMVPPSQGCYGTRSQCEFIIRRMPGPKQTQPECYLSHICRCGSGSVLRNPDYRGCGLFIPIIPQLGPEKMSQKDKKNLWVLLQQKS